MRTDNRTSFKKIKIVAGAFVLVTALTACAGPPKNGGYCKTVGEVGKDSSGQSFVCAKHGRNAPKWQKTTEPTSTTKAPSTKASPSKK